MRLILITTVLAVLSGCASQLSTYVRADGGPIDAAQERATMAQCKGEAATTAAGNGLSDTVIGACMGRNGYIQMLR
jgi:uncharacterized protein YceK